MATRNGLVALAMLAIVGSAAAQGSDPLRGPAVRDNRPPGVQGQMGDAERPGRDRGLPMAEYRRIIDGMSGPEAPAEIRLTPDQLAKIEGFRAEFEKAAEDVRARLRGAGGERPSREEMEQIRATMPRPADVQTKVWAILTPPQQEHMRVQTEKARAELEERRGEQMLRRQQMQRQGGEPGMERPPMGPQGEGRGGDGRGFGQGGAGGFGGMMGDPAQRERFMRLMGRMRDLSPEQRDRVMQALERAVERELGPAPAGGEPQGRGQGQGGEPQRRGPRGGGGDRPGGPPPPQPR